MIARQALLDMIDAAGRTYDPAAVPLCEVLGTAVAIFTVDRGDVLDIANRGTKNAPGWALDFQALPVDTHFGFDHPDIGWVHVGFFAAAHLTFPKILELVKTGRRYRLSGHSLGAAETLILAALLIKAGFPPEALGLFAPPLAGDAEFVSIATSVPFLAFKYGQDPIPDVPGFPPYKQVPLVEIAAPEALRVPEEDIVGRTVFHHWPNYDANCRAWAEAMLPA